MNDEQRRATNFDFDSAGVECARRHRRRTWNAAVPKSIRIKCLIASSRGSHTLCHLIRVVEPHRFVFFFFLIFKILNVSIFCLRHSSLSLYLSLALSFLQCLVRVREYDCWKMLLLLADSSVCALSRLDVFRIKLSARIDCDLISVLPRAILILAAIR